MVLKLAGAAIGLSGGSLLGAVVTPTSTLSLGEITQLIVAVTGLVAAISAFILGVIARRKDPRDKLLEILLEERKEGLEHEEAEADPEPAKRRRRRRDA